MKGILYLEDGTVFEGMGFGYEGTSVGEIVFNTCMTGYQEILTDPSYSAQVVTMTYPLIGNYGVNSDENESKAVYARGFVVKKLCEMPSNYKNELSVDEFLKKNKIVGISEIDTRKITKKIRNAGAMKCVISNEVFEIAKLDKILKETEIPKALVEEATTKEIIHIEGKGAKVVLIDFGAKNNIINNLIKRDCDITVVPYNTSYEEIVKLNPQGVLLSNGPGDPKDVICGIELVKKLIQRYPTFGICLGHQILALAMGGDTYKMKYGHRGGNHGVYDVDIDKAFITSQNHGYAVDKKSIEGKMVITHINLNDDTVEGIRHESLPVFSVQFHPEGAPGPQDTAYLFDNFIKSMTNQ